MLEILGRYEDFFFFIVALFFWAIIGAAIFGLIRRVVKGPREVKARPKSLKARAKSPSLPYSHYQKDDWNDRNDALEAWYQG